MVRFITLFGLVLSLTILPQVVQAEESAPPVNSVASSEEDPLAYKDFETWLREFKEEALAAGIKKRILERAFEDVDEPIESVLEKDRQQPEFKQTFTEYKESTLTGAKISQARALWRKNNALFIKIDNKFDVPAAYLLALWAMESHFGKVQGKYHIIPSLATLAYDGRRSQFFRSQLLDALKIVQKEKISPGDLVGSWAGAMGQTQFMPSSYLQFAYDFNGDGKRDIWNTNSDALASIANYLNEKGWDSKVGWGTPVQLPENSRIDWKNMKERQPLSMWKKIGVKQKDGSMLEGVSREERLILLDGDPEKAYLVTSNFDVLMDWNRSTYFATVIGMFADALGDEP